MLLYKAIEQNKVDLSKPSNKALLKDYEQFKKDKVVEPMIIQEIFRRTKEPVYLTNDDEMGGFTLFLYPDHWRLVDKYWIDGAAEEGQYPIDERHLRIFKPSKEQQTTIELYTIRGKIQNLIDEIIEIRREVAENPDKRFSLFSDFHRDIKELEKLDPFNPELDKGIMGKPIFGSLIDA
jgi:hypothetical protein